jgi:hypothetical protein
MFSAIGVVMSTVVTSALATMLPLLYPASLPTAAAAACAPVEVVFARGRGEPAGPGLVGDAFVKALRTKTIGVYAVNYPVDTQIDVGVPSPRSTRSTPAAPSRCATATTRSVTRVSRRPGKRASELRRNVHLGRKVRVEPAISSISAQNFVAGSLHDCHLFSTRPSIPSDT